MITKDKPVMQELQTAEGAQEAAEVSLSERQIFNRLRKIEGIREQIKALEAQEASLRSEIIGDAQEVMIDNSLYSLQYRMVTSRRFDSKAFSVVHPDLYEAFKKTTSAARFTFRFK